MEKQIQIAKVLSNLSVNPGYSLMEFGLSLPVALMPGQFVNVYPRLEDKILPRPFSVFDCTQDTVSILYKIKGEGTLWMSRLKEKETVRILLPLGNSFPESNLENLCLLAGGIGLAPVHFVLADMKRKKKELSSVSLFYGALGDKHILLKEKLDQIGCRTIYSTDDGSLGEKGTCLESLKRKMDKGFKPGVILSCGPKRMLQAVAKFALDHNLEAHLSSEESMGCGFGACVGCAIKIKGEDSYKLVCKDGPVFRADEVEF